jgi:hypothetical protein
MRLCLARNPANADLRVLVESALRGWLEGALERADDRALFGLGSR